MPEKLVNTSYPSYPSATNESAAWWCRV